VLGVIPVTDLAQGGCSPEARTPGRRVRSRLGEICSGDGHSLPSRQGRGHAGPLGAGKGPQPFNDSKGAEAMAGQSKPGHLAPPPPSMHGSKTL
jgi:hypothetical protein